MESSVVPIDETGVRGFLHIPESSSGDALLLSHGAGGNCQAPLLIALANEFCHSGVTVLRHDLPFRQSRPHGPPMRGSAERDREGIRRAIELLRLRSPSRLFAGGHSYGGRQTTMLLAEAPELADGLLLLSYPLHPPKQHENLRMAHFPALRTASVFVHGTRDGFGSIQEMTEAVKLIPARTLLLPIDGAGHELLAKRNQDELPSRIVDAFAGMFPS